MGETAVATMTKRYDELVEVERDAGMPSAFRWRGRRYEVRDVGIHGPSDSLLLDHGPLAESQNFILKFSSIQDLRRAIILRMILATPSGMSSRMS